MWLLLLLPLACQAELWRVGPTRGTNTSLIAVQNKLKPGDVVEVDFATYTTSSNLRLPVPGTAGNPITIRGIKNANGNRPVLSGGSDTIEFSANNYIFESMEVTGGTGRCVYHHAHNIVISDCVVHDCPAQGILGADCGSGSLTLQYTEVYRCGGDDVYFDHQIYMATDDTVYPGAVFRMQFCYLHEGQGGNGVKSRASRNEIYYNWIEGSYFKALELIGPDLASKSGECPTTDENVREDSDVVGNVLWARAGQPTTRIGGDGTGESFGRYRFASNTFVSSKASAADNAAAIWLFQHVESVQMHNNVFFDVGGFAPIVLRMVAEEFDWTHGEQIAGSNNWVAQGALWARTDPGPTNVGFATSPWVNTVTGPTKNPGFKAGSSPTYDFTLTANSTVRDAGVNPPPTYCSGNPAYLCFTNPQQIPQYFPPWRQLFNFSFARNDVGGLAIGAYTDADAGTSAGTPNDSGGGGFSSSAHRMSQCSLLVVGMAVVAAALPFLSRN